LKLLIKGQRKERMRVVAVVAAIAVAEVIAVALVQIVSDCVYYMRGILIFLR